MTCTAWWSDLYLPYVLNAGLEVGASRALLRLVPVPVGLLVAALECATHTMHGPYACPAVHKTVALCVECSDKHRTLPDWELLDTSTLNASSSAVYVAELCWWHHAMVVSWLISPACKGPRMPPNWW